MSCACSGNSVSWSKRQIDNAKKLTYLNVTFNSADLNLTVLNAPRLVCINFNVFNRNT